jgi:hypothetical protein
MKVLTNIAGAFCVEVDSQDGKIIKLLGGSYSDFDFDLYYISKTQEYAEEHVHRCVFINPQYQSLVSEIGFLNVCKLALL